MIALDQVVDRLFQMVLESIPGGVINGAISHHTTALFIDGDYLADQLRIDQGWAGNLQLSVPVLEHSAEVNLVAFLECLPRRNINALDYEDDDLH